MKGIIGISITVVLITLLAIGWFYMRQTGSFTDRNPDKINLCRKSSSEIIISWKDPDLKINRFRASRNEDDTVHVSIGFVRNESDDNSVTVSIDTLKDRYIELHGAVYTISEIPVCR
ncbi:MULTISPECIES: hypothetical protein [unclassified Dysgonomonas]|uniref:hypothetical protein n=1 Tax=unclassified Dysgonomonas TaxID=2630389 RepID=UPI0013EAF0BC|nr:MULTISPECIES: hypothetical protein [unclassified Dysgonomonas]